MKNRCIQRRWCIQLQVGHEVACIDGTCLALGVLDEWNVVGAVKGGDALSLLIV